MWVGGVRLVLVGWGAIGRTAARLLADGSDAEAIDLVAVAVRSATADRPPAPCPLITDPSELAEYEPDVVAEAAGRDSVAPWGRAALAAGADFVVSSTSALADATVLDELRRLAATSGASVQIQPGALGGIDALSAARHLGLEAVEHQIVKPPRAWAGTPAEELCDLDTLTEPTTFFSGDAAETATAFPKNANVAMTTALAGIGPAATRITLVADPGAGTNRHEIRARGGFGELDVTISNNPLPDNPKTSAMAALGLVRAIEQRVAPIAI